jgi:hypothetical protein
VLGEPREAVRVDRMRNKDAGHAHMQSA